MYASSINLPDAWCFSNRLIVMNTAHRLCTWSDVEFHTYKDSDRCTMSNLCAGGLWTACTRKREGGKFPVRKYPSLNPTRAFVCHPYYGTLPPPPHPPHRLIEACQACNWQLQVDVRQFVSIVKFLLPFLCAKTLLLAPLTLLVFVCSIAATVLSKDFLRETFLIWSRKKLVLLLYIQTQSFLLTLTNKSMYETRMTEDSIKLSKESTPIVY